ncbi:3-hydroxyacyl-CoA dehydrogenase family protein [Cryobacterium sp. Hh7]|uniref:3-hydroxyacyl-CoA dehydrogenase family protein n=1 Tax=Cryobacterium sp. Hh7 TaxID=1259159 RepID=UPI00106C70BF|nr:3-hydroxyacyl-CoA dehydrogenase family protein [Cryobacterium sp. Hh7]TFD56947.1 3-hydroxyacyl-CoA dehydrogenase family protein [Cryobacterium sp. Hh7]
MIERIQTVAVIGAGYMGGGIAQSLASAGFAVTIADVSAEASRAQLERLLTESQQFEDQGLFAQGSTETVRTNLRAADTIEEAVAGVDFVEEAVTEIVAVKHEVLRRVSAAARGDAIIGSNTSTIPVRVLESAVEHPERFLTVHWSNPAPFIPGVELVAGEQTDRALIPVVKEMLARAGRSSALVADVPGFVLNRLQYVLLKEAMSIVEEGIATPEDVDTIVSSTFGFRLAFFGPFAIADMAGLDVYANGFRTLGEEFGPRLATPKMLEDAVKAGRHGTKNGAGLTGNFAPEQVEALVAYRSEAYSRLAQLVRELGPSPIH